MPLPCRTVSPFLTSTSIVTRSRRLFTMTVPSFVNIAPDALTALTATARRRKAKADRERFVREAGGAVVGLECLISSHQFADLIAQPGSLPSHPPRVIRGPSETSLTIDLSRSISICRDGYP